MKKRCDSYGRDEEKSLKRNKKTYLSENLLLDSTKNRILVRFLEEYLTIDING
ncbi:MAG: hypothetical protein H6544_00130 [Prevotellaceae bacterium]|nr:hypothetical protein [Prevotellaceae bacterium]